MTYEVAVRTLCEFTAKRGNLDMRFTPSPSAMEGMAGHRVIASRRGNTFQTELILIGDYGSLRVRGRADGYDPDQNRLEEFKTYRGELTRMPENHRALHWAQLRIYGWLLCKHKALASVKLALVYFDVASERETVFDEEQSAADLEQHFVGHCEHFVAWAESDTAHRLLRDAALRVLRFPFADFHGGQRELSRAVYKRVRAGSALLAQAPTGIGKTVGTLFPALKAMGTQGAVGPPVPGPSAPAESGSPAPNAMASPAAAARDPDAARDAGPARGPDAVRGGALDKVFYLVAKTSGRQLALDALKRFQPADSTLPLRVVELVARGKACENPGLPCDGAVCPLARGFYDRLPAARAEAIDISFLDQEAVRQVARRHEICPYYLSQELARWSDVVVGDYNYYFDRSAMLFGWTVTHEWRVCLLVDEAHNLVERARTMYTASLDFDAFNAVRKRAPDSLTGSLESLRRIWSDMNAAQDEPHRIYDEPPEALITALDKLISVLVDHLSTHAGQDEALQELFFEALSFSRLAADYDSSTLFEVTLSDTQRSAGRQPGLGPRVTPKVERQSVLCLRNLVPGRFLAPRFTGAQSAVLFSATLVPHEFFRDILGLPQSCGYLDVQSPFQADQLAVRLVRSISTRFKDRARSLAPIADLLARQYAAQPGNYLVFLSSFEYLENVATLVAQRYPTIPTWQQHSGMTEPQRDAFLSRFVPEGAGVGFAVLGGAFAEGVDLPGSRLIGAFVATLGLPQVNAVNEEMQRRMQTRFGSGYEYTYLYPGIQKVVQAAGRVIRTTTDRGVLYLIDDRFTHSRVRKLLPQWWNVDPVVSPRPSSAV
ncbi:MAG TPA: ATP-dependent DNA helicase [Steroidobacteraceae bacterium]|nr:ATP-dependent DNA helicase [Steroidobacteraceae bacterium]